MLDGLEGAIAQGGVLAEIAKKSKATIEKHGMPRMAEILPRFAEEMDAGFPSLQIHGHIMPDETHMSVDAAAYARGFRYVFGHWMP